MRDEPRGADREVESTTKPGATERDSNGSACAPTDRSANPSRRSVLGGLAAVVGTGVAGGAVLATTPEPTAAVDGDPVAFEAGDAPTVTSNDGRIESVYLSPRLEVSWTDFSAGIDAVTVLLAVGGPAGVDVVYEETMTAVDPEATPGDIATVDVFDAGAVDGRLELTFERADATDRGDAVTSERLSDSALTGGESASTTLDLVLRADLVGGSDEATVVRTTAVDVTVENPAGDATAGGEVEVDAA